MPRADIANYLRLAPETVSRLFRRFRDESLLVVRGREIEITDRDRLQRLAEAGNGA
jgi:CRP/FNR family transcriptional regulator